MVLMMFSHISAPESQWRWFCTLVPRALVLLEHMKQNEAHILHHGRVQRLLTTGQSFE
jgi:hypothetical protein